MSIKSDEAVLAVAQQNAATNQQRLINTLSSSIAKREKRLLTKYRKHKGNAASKLEELFEDIEIIYAGVEPFTACERGCNACCHYPVSVSEAEVQRIEHATGYRRGQNLPQYEVSRYDPCPFLRGAECGIYEHRPYVCRTHTALTNTAHWCATERCNDATFPMGSVFGGAQEF